jgi:hypothetical protein
MFERRSGPGAQTRLFNLRLREDEREAIRRAAAAAGMSAADYVRRAVAEKIEADGRRGGAGPGVTRGARPG